MSDIEITLKCSSPNVVRWLVTLHELFELGIGIRRPVFSSDSAVILHSAIQGMQKHISWYLNSDLCQLSDGHRSLLSNAIGAELFKYPADPAFRGKKISKMTDEEWDEMKRYFKGEG